MVAAAGAAVGAVDVEGLGATAARLAGLLVERLELLALLGEARRRRDVDLDDAGVGRDRHRRQPGVRRRPVALDDHRAVSIAAAAASIRVIRSTKWSSSSVGGRKTYSSPSRTSATIAVVRRRVVRRRRRPASIGFGFGPQSAPGRPADRPGTVVPRRVPADRVQRQPQSGRRVAVEQHDAAAAQLPVRAGPAPARPRGGEAAARRRPAPTTGSSSRASSVGPGVGVVGGEVVLRRDAARPRAAARQRPAGSARPRRRAGPGWRQAQPVGDRARAADWPASGASGRRCGPVGPRIGQQRRVGPQRLAVGAPVEPDLPPRQRFSRIPLALAALHQTVRRPHRLEPVRQVGGALPLVRAVGVGGPLRVDLVVDRDERRLAAHGQPDVTGGEPIVDAGARAR